MTSIRTPPAPRSILRNSPLQISHTSSPRKKVSFVDLTEEDQDSLPITMGKSLASKSLTAGRGLQLAAMRGGHAAQINGSLSSPISSPSARAAATLSANKNRRSSGAAGDTNPTLPHGLTAQIRQPKCPRTLDGYNTRDTQTQPFPSRRAASTAPHTVPAASSLKPANMNLTKDKSIETVIDLTMDNEVASTKPLDKEKLPSLDDARAHVSKAIRKVDWSMKNEDRIKDQLLFTEELLDWDSSASDSDSERSIRRKRIRGTRYVANMNLLPQALERSSKTGVPPIVPTTRQDPKPAKTPVDRLMNDGIERGFNKDWLRSTIGRKTRRIRFHETGIDFLIATRKEKRRQEREGDERVRRRVEECDKLHLSLTVLARNYQASHPGTRDKNARGLRKAGKSTELAYKRKPIKMQSSTVGSSPRSTVNDGSLKDWADAFSILDFDEAGRLRNSSSGPEDKFTQSSVSPKKQRTEQDSSPAPLDGKTTNRSKDHPKELIEQKENQDSSDEMLSPIEGVCNPETAAPASSTPKNEPELSSARDKAAVSPSTVKIKSEPVHESYTGITDDELVAMKREYFDSDEEDNVLGYPPLQTTFHIEAPRHEVTSRSSEVHIKREVTSDEEADSNTADNTPATMFTGHKHVAPALSDIGTLASSKKASKKRLLKLPSAPQLDYNPSPSTLRRFDLGDDDQDFPRQSSQQSGVQIDRRQSSASKKRKAVEDGEDCPPPSKQPRTLPTANADNTKSNKNHQGGMAPIATSADLREKKALRNRRARLKKKARKERQREEDARAAAIMAKKKHVKDEQKKPDSKAPATTPPKTKKKKKNKKNAPVAKSPARGTFVQG
ncbi:hypothetical protein MCOR25_001754 [Pyricularia grisea]|nr:hypothetical protein MCOR25_001754 [Pyricularia grisea]